MKLKDRLMNLSSIDSQWGIWADAPFTEDSESRVGQLQFENGGLLDDKEYVGCLDEFDFEACEILLAWSEIRDGAAFGTDNVLLSNDPHISAENLLDLIAGSIDADAKISVGVSEIEAWEAGDRIENLDVAEAGSHVSGRLYHLKYEEYDRDTEIYEAIKEAEEDRLERKRIEAEITA